MKLIWLGPWFILSALALLLIACGNDETPQVNNATVTNAPPSTMPTVVAVVSTATPDGPSLTPSPTFPATHTLLPTNLPASAIPTHTPTQTPPPYIVEVQQGDTCGSIAVRWGLDLVGGAAAIRQANPNLNAGCTNLPYPGQVIVPRPTGTPTPMGYDVTLTVIATALPPSLLNVTPFAIYQHCIQEGDTLTSISLQYNASRQRICDLNPLPDGIDCRTCNFATDGSNARCATAPLLSVNDCLNVPGATFTPQPTPTFTGLETPTPFPTYLPPQAVYPPNGATAQGSLQLAWLSVGQLKPDEYYLVSVFNESTSELIALYQTRQTSYALPREWQPVAGQTLPLLWSVEVIYRPSAENYISRSPRSVDYRVIWQG